jgi:hypothetical protein
MASTLKEIAYSVLESIRNFHIVDDNDISIDWIVKKINDINVKLVEADYKSGKNLEGYMQKQCCIEIICEKQYCTIDGVLVESGDVLWYSDVPTLNNKIGNGNIAYLGLSDMKTAFRRTSMTGSTVSGKLEYGNNKTIYNVIGNKIFYNNLPTTGSKYVCMVGILEDPTTACNWDDDDPYPTPDTYKLELLVKQDIMSSFNIPKDVINDAQDSLGTQPIK